MRAELNRHLSHELQRLAVILIVLGIDHASAIAFLARHYYGLDHRNLRQLLPQSNQFAVWTILRDDVMLTDDKIVRHARFPPHTAGNGWARHNRASSQCP
jgi:hypothetical protein